MFLRLHCVSIRRLFLLSILLSLIACLAGPAPGLLAQTVQFNGAIRTLGSGFSAPFGVAVDRSGNVFALDESNNSVELKEIVAVNGSIPASPTVNTLSGLYAPAGVAVDGSGNVFVTDYDPVSSSGVVKEIIAVNGSIPASPAIKTLANGFYTPTGLAVDGSWNVFVADYYESPSNSGAVKEIVAVNGSIPASPTIKILASGFFAPRGVAVDSSGNVFVGDYYTGLLTEIVAVNGSIPTSPAIKTLYVDSPTGVAVDGSGNVFVSTCDSDSGYAAVKEIVAVNGSIPASPTINTLGSGFYDPSGVAVDGSGNVLVADSGNHAVKEIVAGGNFGSVNVGSTSAAPLILYFTFNGAAVPLPTAVLTQGAAGLDFTGGSCQADASYYIHDICTVNVTFKPTAPGPRYGAVELLDVSGNLLATGYVQGTGVGPQVNFLPGTQSSLGNGFNHPYGVAVDASGNVFVADESNNAVKEIVAVNGSIPTSPTINTLGSGFNAPTGVAVDGNGNVLVADSGNGLVKEIVAVNGSIPASPTINTLASGFYDPSGVAVDGSGNVFATNSDAGSGYAAVVEIVAVNGSIPASPTIKILGSGFYAPSGVAVDSSGNVFVVDIYTSSLTEIVAVNGSIPDSPTIKTLASGLDYPHGVAVDASGNVFVTSSDTTNAVKEIVAVNGSIPASPTINTLGSGFRSPYGVALAASGNVFVADFLNNRVEKLDFADPPSLSFAATMVGSESSDSPQLVTVTNNGNAALMFPIPATGNNPSIASGFTLGASTTCPESSTSSSEVGTLTQGTSCTYAVDFNPVALGTTSGSLVLTDNHLNAAGPGYATQAIQLSGTGLGEAPVFTSASSTTFTVGRAGSFTVTTTGTPAPSFTESEVLPSGVTFSTSGILSGTPVSGTSGSYPITITASNGVNLDAKQNFTLMVSKATTAVTWATPAAITYGTALSGTQLDASSGGVAGTFAYSPSAGTVLGAGSQTGACQRV